MVVMLMMAVPSMEEPSLVVDVVTPSLMWEVDPKVELLHQVVACIVVVVVVVVV